MAWTGPLQDNAAPIPTLEEIEQRREAIKSGWTEVERQQRAVAAGGLPPGKSPVKVLRIYEAPDGKKATWLDGHC